MSVPGFCGRPAPGPTTPTTDDPSADLIGHTFPVDTGGVGTVMGAAPWDSGYVLIDTDAGLTVRAAALVRRRKESA